MRVQWLRYFTIASSMAFVLNIVLFTIPLLFDRCNSRIR